MTKGSLKSEKRRHNFLVVFTEERKNIHCKRWVLDLKSPTCSLCYYYHTVSVTVVWIEMILSFRRYVDIHSNDLRVCHNVYSSQILIVNTRLFQRALVTLESAILAIYITRNFYERTNMKPQNSISSNIKLKSFPRDTLLLSINTLNSNSKIVVLKSLRSLLSDFIALTVIWLSSF